MANDEDHPVAGNDDLKIYKMDPREAAIRAKLSELRQEHRDLDDSIQALERAGTFDQLQVQRFKKRKLMIRDEISKVEAMLHPDIIA